MRSVIAHGRADLGLASLKGPANVREGERQRHRRLRSTYRKALVTTPVGLYPWCALHSGCEWWPHTEIVE